MGRLLEFALFGSTVLALLLDRSAPAQAQPPRGCSPPQTRSAYVVSYPASYVVYYSTSGGTARVSYYLYEPEARPASAAAPRVSFYSGGQGGAARPAPVVRYVSPGREVLPLSEMTNANIPSMSQ
jgi:hypothetical protein